MQGMIFERWKFFYFIVLIYCFQFSLLTQGDFIYHGRNGKNYSIPPIKEYGYEHFSDMIGWQKKFIIKEWEVPNSLLNPGMSSNPRNLSEVYYCYRIPTRSHYERAGYFVLDPKTWNRINNGNEIVMSIPTISTERFYGEDLRLFTHNYDLYISYNFHIRTKTVFYSKVYHDVLEDTFYVFNNSIMLKFMNQDQVQHEKNWVSFEYCPHCIFKSGILSPDLWQAAQPKQDETEVVQFQSFGKKRKSPEERERERHNISWSHIQHAELFFARSIQPHIVVRPYLNQENNPYDQTAELAFVTEVTDLYWPWGTIRGGSQALPIDDNSYLSFFHSTGKYNFPGITSYVMGAYLFERNPPFRITHFSPEPIITENMINESYGWTYKATDFVVFPMGFVLTDDEIFLSYGKNDRNGWILQLKKKEFLESLIPVTSIVLGESEMNEKRTDIVRRSFKYIRTYSPNGFSLPIINYEGRMGIVN